MNAPEPNQNLARALADWRVTPARNPDFRAETWARIAAAQQAPSWAVYLRTHGALVAGALAVAVAVGAWTGSTEARERDAAARASLVGSYVHGLDARWMRR